MALVTSPMFVGQAYKQTYYYGVSSVLETDENMSTFQFGYAVHVALKDIIGLRTSQLFESGIFTYNLKNLIHFEDFKSKPEAIGPQVLTIDHLGAGFVIILVCLGISSVVFAIECAPILFRILKKLTRMTFACYVVVKFIRMNKIF